MSDHRAEEKTESWLSTVKGSITKHAVQRKIKKSYPLIIYLIIREVKRVGKSTRPLIYELLL